MKKLFKLTGRLQSSFDRVSTIYILAVDSAAAAAESVNQNMVFAFGHLDIEEIEAKGITPAEMSAFVTKYNRDPAIKAQRFGQAFLNEFDHVPVVAANRWGHYLWEEKYTNIALDKIADLGLIDWEGA